MRFFEKVKDGGPESPVTAYVLIEIKPLFSIMLLRFPSYEMRENFHSHAFSALTFWIKGEVVEEQLGMDPRTYIAPAFKLTPWWNMHRIKAITNAWAISFRGPWRDTWQEYRANNPPDSRFVTLTHGRKEIV